ncbi:MAG: hypothetical protein ABIJ59_08850 [Pseudomonadota bacterium]
MKIVSAMTAFSSENQFEQLDLSLNEKSSKKSVSDTGISQNRTRQNRISLDRAQPGDMQSLSQILVDRVSIQQNKRKEYQSNYSADISSQSKVTSLASDEIIDYSQQYAMEKLVNGIIDKQVVINRIEQKEDIFLPENRILSNGDTNLSRAQVQSSGEWEMSLKQTDIHFEDESVQFASQGQVTTQDGRMIDFSLDLSLNRSFLSRKEEETLIHRWQESVTLTDPLVISLDGKVPQLSDARFEFDLNSDGNKENINFVASGSGFLTFDKNNDGKVNNGSELFGPGTGNGFEELAAYDQDQNNWIDENDAIFSQLSVWTKDDQGNDQLISLKDAGLGAIALDYAPTTFNLTKEENTLQGKMQRTGVFLYENGQVGSVHQIDLVSHKPEHAQELTINASLDSSKSSPGMEPPVFTSVSITEQPQNEEVSNPLKDLLERIEKLKEEMGRLYEAMNPVTSQKRSRRGGRRYYQEIRMDSSVLLSGYHRGITRLPGRYA